MKAEKNHWITIRKSSIHNKGGFAKRRIPIDTKVIEYVGDKISKKESQRRSKKALRKNQKNDKYGAVYLFELNKKYDIDGNVSFNKARFINHSCTPNCEALNIKGEIWIVAIKDIEKGEEVTYNYGYGWETYEEHPCGCGSPKCVGYILSEEHWPKLKRQRSKKASSTA